MTAKGESVSFRDDKNILTLTVAMVAHICEDAKSHWTVPLKWVHRGVQRQHLDQAMFQGEGTLGRADAELAAPGQAREPEEARSVREGPSHEDERTLCGRKAKRSPERCPIAPAALRWPPVGPGCPARRRAPWAQGPVHLWGLHPCPPHPPLSLPRRPMALLPRSHPSLCLTRGDGSSQSPARAWYGPAAGLPTSVRTATRAAHVRPLAASLRGGGEHSAPGSPLPGRRAGRRCCMSQTGCVSLWEKSSA